MPRAETTQSRQTIQGPTAAERARTLAYGVADGVLVAPGVPYAPVPAHTTDRDGRPLLLVRADAPIAAALAARTTCPPRCGSATSPRCRCRTASGAGPGCTAG
ncbi:hypothetical protein ACFQY7_29740 [Actinomadura luteofluorescens]|uniref:hypothetical protein n=1 Tax=Actinomadura luteofluorescens TaxID=46163 RepID=UPI0036344350